MMRAIKPDELKGTLIGVPIVNMAGFARGSRYLPDRRDLNRFFPGTQRGSAASRIAYSFFNEIARRCDSIVDFHTGSFERSNLPQVRGDLRIPAVLRFTRGFGDTTVLHTPGAPGMLRRAATDVGIPAVTFELGAPIRLQPKEIEHGVKAMETLLNQLGMVERFRVRRQPQPIYYDSRWVRAGAGGFLFADVALGDQVSAGQRLGRIVDPITHEEYLLQSPFAGRVLGMALNQVVMPGFAAFHIGGRTTEAKAVREAILRQPESLNNLELEDVDEAGEGAAASRGAGVGDTTE
jgi:predicted deacylase